MGLHETSGQGEPCLDFHSPFDSKVTLHLDFDEYEGWIDWHLTSPEFACRLMVETARHRGWVEIEDCPMEDLGEDWWRMHLVTDEPIYDRRDLSTTMPDLSKTGYGPLSGFMEAIG